MAKSKPYPFLLTIRLSIMTKKLYILLIIAVCFSFASCISDNNNECATNSRLNVSFVADIDNRNMQTRSTKSGFSENDNIGIYMVDYVDEIPMHIGTISNFMNAEHVYNGSFWNSRNGEELYLTTDQTKSNLYAYYPFDYEMSRSPEKRNLATYPFSVESDQSLSSQKSDFLWAKYSGLSSSNTIAKLTFRHLLTKVIINATYGNLGTGNESVIIQNLSSDASINMENGDVLPKGAKSNSEIIPFTQKVPNMGFDKTLSAIITPQLVASGTSIFTVNVNDVLYAFTLDNSLLFESGYTYTFNLVIGEANTRSTETSGTKHTISFVSKTSF